MVVCLFVLLLPFFIFSQTRTHRFNIGIDVSAGHSFPDYDQNSRWKGSFYPTGALSVLIQNRMGNHFQTELGIGVSAYALVNKGPYDKYVFDFMVPQFFTGIQYIRNKGKNRESFIRMNTGIQPAYHGVSVETFSQYQVLIQNERSLNFFLQPAIGFKNRFKERLKGHRHFLAYEAGAFFRYNFYRLGTALFIEENYITQTSPGGNSIGIYFRVLIPTGHKRLTVETDTDPKGPRNKTTRHL